MNMKVTGQRSPRPVGASLVVGLLCCLPGNNLYPQTAVETNVVVVSDGSSPTNASPGYAGAAAAVLGFAQLGTVSDASTSLFSLTGDAQEASDLELSLASGLEAAVSHAAVVSQREGTFSEASAAKQFSVTFNCGLRLRFADVNRGRVSTGINISTARSSSCLPCPDPVA